MALTIEGDGLCMIMGEAAVTVGVITEEKVDEATETAGDENFGGIFVPLTL